MHPILFKLGPFAIHTYGLLLALGAGLGLWLAHRLAPRVDLDPDKTVNVAFWTLFSGLLGSRLVFVMLEPQQFVSEPWRILYLWEGGLVFYGGLAAGIPVGYLLTRRWKMSMLDLLDTLAPGVALAQGFGRLGCFMAGCCFGLPWQGWCAVTFDNPETLAPQGIPLHPVQLYSAASLFVIFLVSFWLFKQRRFSGQVFFTYGLLHGLVRLILEQFRGDWRGEILLLGLTPTGLAAAALALVSAGALLYLSRRGGKERS